MTWEPPWDINGDIGHVRLTASLLGTPLDAACLENLALRAHPEVYPRDDEWTPRRYNPYETFGLGIVRDAILESERRDASAAGPWRDLAREAVTGAAARLQDRLVPEAMVRWATAATETYLDVSEELCARHSLVPGPREPWRVLHRGAGDAVSEITAWGLAYADEIGSVRELRLFRLRALDTSKPIAAPYLAAAALATATGVRTTQGDRPTYPHSASTPPDPVPELVRIRVVSLADGGDELLWEGSPDDARMNWAPHRALANALTSGGSVTPGESCFACKAREVCAALPSAPGLLGLPGFGTHPRSLAPTALSTYDLCPARYLLTKVIRLPRADQDATNARQRGLDVHLWLQYAHGRDQACTAADLPEDGVTIGAIAEEAGLDRDAYLRALPYLRQHLHHCPIPRATAPAWPERNVVIRDPDADVTISTRPDLLLTTAEGPVWRETKTLAQLSTASNQQLLRIYPQAALAVCALADDAVGEPFVRGTGVALVELELLTPEGAYVATYDCSDEQVELTARRAIAEAANDWHGDDTFTATPGEHCARCEVARWCPSAGNTVPAGSIVHIGGIAIDVLTGEVIAAVDANRRATVEEAMAVTSATSGDTDDDIDFPF